MPSTAHITCKGPLLLVDSCSPPSLLASADQSCSGNGDALFEERGGLCWQIHHKPRPPTSLSIAQRTSKFSASSTPWLSPAQRTRRGSPALASIHGSHALPAPGLSSCKAEGGTREDPSQHQGAAAAAPPREKTSSAVPDSSRGLNSLKLLFAGAMSAVVSRTCCAPLERLKMEQVLRQSTGGAMTTAHKILRQEGISGFWRGNALNVLRTAPFKAVNFFCFDSFHRAMVLLSGRDGNAERFASGAMAGITATVVCFPLDVVRTRLMARAHGLRYGNDPFRTLAGIVKYEGPSALYTGCLPAVIGMAPAGAVFYGVYDLLKHNHLEALERAGCSSPSIPSAYTLMYGALAGACSELLVYPLEVLRRRLQVQSMVASTSHHPTLGGRAAAAAAAAHAASKASGMQHMQQSGSTKGVARVLQTLLAIVRAEGLQGLYAGMGPNILQVLPSAALSYYTYDTVKQLLGAE